MRKSGALHSEGQSNDGDGFRPGQRSQIQWEETKKPSVSLLKGILRGPTNEVHPIFNNQFEDF